MDNHPSFSYENIEILFTSGTFSQEVQRRRQTAGNAETIFSFRSPYRYNSELKITETRATSEIRLNNYGAGDASSLDAKMEENYRRLYAVYNRYLETADVKPSEAKAKIIGDLNKSIKNCLGLELSSLGNVEDNQGTLYFTKSDHPKSFEFNVLSSGEKEVIDLLLDLYLRKDDYSESIFLLDEPELHINTAIQSKLLVEINNLVGKNCQIWLTTHSIGFLRALQTEIRSDCQIILFREDYQLASKPYVLKPIKMTPAIWREIFAIALDDLALLVCPKTIIYCEGRAEPGAGGRERGLDATVLNNIFGQKHPEVLFVSSGGNTELDQRSAVAMAILSKVFPSLEILVLKDRDMASGKDTNESDRQLYLKNNLSSHRVLKRWEIENYLYDKTVLQAYCISEGLSFDESAYDSFVSDITNENLKDKTSHIKNFCNIKSNISPDIFKIGLSSFLVSGTSLFDELERCIFQRD